MVGTGTDGATRTRVGCESERVCLCYISIVLQCGRDFLMDLTSRRNLAVSISAVSFHQLDDAVTERWLRESCPGTHLPGDEEDRKSKIAELFVSDEPIVRSKHH